MLVLRILKKSINLESWRSRKSPWGAFRTTRGGSSGCPRCARAKKRSRIFRSAKKTNKKKNNKSVEQTNRTEPNKTNPKTEQKKKQYPSYPQKTNVGVEREGKRGGKEGGGSEGEIGREGGTGKW